MFTEGVYQKAKTSFNAIGYYQSPDVSDGLVKISLCHNTERVLRDIEKRYSVCPLCGEEIDVSEKTKSENEFDPLVRPWIDLGIDREREPRFVQMFRNDNLLFKYECGHKLIIYPAFDADPLPDNAQATMFVKNPQK